MSQGSQEDAKNQAISSKAKLGGNRALLEHIKFFDLNKDGKITIWETYQGFRLLGFNFLLSIFAAVTINFSMAWPTSSSWWPTTTITVQNVERAMHGSDTGVYDENGEFD